MRRIGTSISIGKLIIYFLLGFLAGLIVLRIVFGLGDHICCVLHQSRIKG